MIPIATRNDIQMADFYTNDVDYFLFESKIPTNGGSYGGSGQQFDWSILQRYQGSVPFLLTGGIGKEDAEQIAHFHHPQFIGIDLNSRFETAPALKDTKKIRAFVDKIRNLA
jgi:phosphoribosylanthranilate isomerase